MTYSGNNINSMKRENRRAVLTLIQRHGALSRKYLAEALQLTPAAITKIVSNLIDEGLLVEVGSVRAGSSAGRSQILLEINGRARCGLGVLFNLGRAVLTGVRLDGSLVFSEEIALHSPVRAEETIPMLTARLRRLIEAHGIGRHMITGLGVACRGIISADRRTLVDSLGVFDSRHIPLVELFERASELPVVLDNNVRTLFAAQMFMDREARNECQFFLRCEYGIGAALSINDEIWIGGKGRCSEIGHIQVHRRGGRPCACGKSGCLETIASPSAMLSEALRALSPGKTPLLWALKEQGREIGLMDVLDCASNGDPGAARIVENAIRTLGQALKSVIYIIDPQRIILYGSLFEHHYYLSQLMAEMAVGQDKDHADVVIEKSTRNNQLDAIAAGILSVNSFLDSGGITDENDA